MSEPPLKVLFATVRSGALAIYFNQPILRVLPPDVQPTLDVVINEQLRELRAAFEGYAVGVGMYNFVLDDVQGGKFILTPRGHGVDAVRVFWNALAEVANKEYPQLDAPIADPSDEDLDVIRDELNHYLRGAPSPRPRR